MSQLWCGICRVAVACGADVIANGVTICAACWRYLVEVGWHPRSDERYVICHAHGEELDDDGENVPLKP